MKNLLVDYFKVIIYTVIGFVLVVSSFYLLINYYHSEELKRTVFISSNDNNYIDYQEKIKRITNNLEKFKSKNNHTTEENLLYESIFNCQMVMQEAGTFGHIPVNINFTNKNVYDLGSKFQSRVYNVCWAQNLSSIANFNHNSKFYIAFEPINKSVSLLSNQNQYALKELENNSSYFYSTNISSYIIRNYLETDYEIIVSSYNSFADIVLYLSELLNGGV